MVTAVVKNPGLTAGDVLDGTGAEYFKATVASAVYSKGQVLVRDTSLTPDGFKLATAAANLQGPFVMVYLDPGTSAVTQVSVVKGGTWAVTCDGVIEPEQDCIMSSSTDGQVVGAAAIDTTPTLTETTVELAINYYKTVVGRSAGFADNYKSGTPAVTADGDLVAVDANAGYRGG